MSRGATALLFVTALAGCFRREPAPRPNEGSWAETRDHWTRRMKLYDGVDPRAFAVATYLPMEARLARADRTASWKAMTQSERDALLVKEQTEADSFDEFLLAFYTPVPDHNDLANRASIWRIALVVSEGDVLPAEVTQLSRKDETTRELFSYVGDFDAIYRVRFKRGAQGSLSQRPFTLRIASAVGKLDLAW